MLEHWVQQLAWECECYGATVVAAFGEYCAQRTRLVQHVPRLAADLCLLSAMALRLMRGAPSC